MANARAMPYQLTARYEGAAYCFQRSRFSQRAAAEQARREIEADAAVCGYAVEVEIERVAGAGEKAVKAQANKRACPAGR